MQSPFLAALLASICTMASAQWTAAIYSDFKCSGSSSVVSNAAANTASTSQTCMPLATPFPAGTQVGGTEDGCVVQFYQTSDCSDTGCQGMGVCCSQNNKKKMFLAYEIFNC